MSHPKLHRFADWCIIILILLCIFGTTTTSSLWHKVFPIAPLIIFAALCLLFLNYISVIGCFKSKDKDFFLMAGAILLSLINIILVKSRLGAFFTIADFLLILYLADKIHFDKVQLGVIAAACLLLWFYWQFINKETYLDSSFNANTPPAFMFALFCIFISCLPYLFPKILQMPKWSCHVFAVLIIFLLTKRALDFHCRGALVALAAWIFTYLFLPKRKETILPVIGLSLLFPLIYVLMWKNGIADGTTLGGKNLYSGRDRIWYEFFKVYIQHPITGIGSDFEKMLPDLYLKEVHHSLLDLLFVHGLPVFVCVLYLMYRRIAEVISSSSGLIRDLCLASIYGMLALGTIENYYIAPPYNAMFMVIFIVCHSSLQEQASSIHPLKS